MRTKEEMYNDIREWEMEAGEDFLDYFGASMNEYNFMFWCLGKGYITEYQLQAFEAEKHTGTEYLIGTEIYSVVNEEENKDWDSACAKAYRILADFFTATMTYQKRVDRFLNNVRPVKAEDLLREMYRHNIKIFYEDGEQRVYITKETSLPLQLLTQKQFFIDNNA